jgi:hypothetical protein
MNLSELPTRRRFLRKEPPYVTGWRQSIQNHAGEFFLLFEDDFWITSSLPIFQIFDCMKKQRLDAVKLSDQGLHRFGVRMPKTSGMLQRFTTLAVLESRQSLFRRFAYKAFVGRFKLGRAIALLIVKIRILEGFDWANAAAANPIAGTAFRTSWWLTLWAGFQQRIDENIQVRLAHEALLKSKPGESPLALAPEMVVRTSYRTSVSAKHASINFEVANRVLSDYWLLKDIRVDDSGDWSIDHIEQILLSDTASLPFALHYRVWSEDFYKIYN